MSYLKYHNIDIFSLKEVTYVEKYIILKISGHDTLKPLGI